MRESGELSLARCLEQHRRSGSAGLSLAVLDVLDSSNSLALRVARPYLESDRPVPRLAVVARRQSAGRGRRGRRWRSPAGEGIYTSLLLPVAGARELAALPLRVPLALCQALDGHGVDCRIKWPNDLLVGGRKLGGVLLESLGGRAVVVGYGINGLQDEASLPEPGATSLRLAIGRPPDLSRLAVELLETVAGRLAGEPAAELVAAYRERSAHRPGDPLTCRLGGEQIAGAFAGFDERGRLRLDTPAGERLLGSAELISAPAVAAAERPPREVPG